MCNPKGIWAQMRQMRRSGHRYGRHRRGIVLTFCLVATSALASPAQDIRQLIEAGKPREADTLAQQLMTENAGEPEFDFWLGLARIEASKPGEAVFALERVLIAKPAHHRARLELARAHFMLGDLSAARAEFETVLAQDPPANVRTRIGTFLQQISDLSRRARFRLGGSASIAAGYDTNVNSATEANELVIPAFNVPLRLSDDGREQEDGFRELAASAHGQYLVNRQRAWFGGLSINNRDNFSTDSFDTTQFAVSAGAALTTASTATWRFPLGWQRLQADGSTVRDLTTAGVSWQRNITAGGVSGSLQAGFMDYPDQPSRDARMALAGWGWSYRGDSGGGVTAGIYGGAERAVRDTGKHNGRDYVILRADGRTLLTPTLHATLGAVVQQTEHTAPDVVFAVTRRDTFYQLSAGLSWSATKRLNLSLNLDGFANDSNLALYEYDRSQVKGVMSYGF